MLLNPIQVYEPMYMMGPVGCEPNLTQFLDPLSFPIEKLQYMEYFEIKGNRAQELEKLGGVDNRVGDRRAFDDALLGQFGTKVAQWPQLQLLCWKGTCPRETINTNSLSSKH
jgi:hypothetical protein